MRRRREPAQTGAAYQKLALARAMRRQPTRCEALLWIELRRQRMVFRFRRQHIIAGYIVDLYCPAARLAIAVDGASHVDAPTRIANAMSRSRSSASR